MTTLPQFEKARDYITDRMSHELSHLLTYHRLEHTINEVVPATDRLASLENVGAEDCLLLLTAAYYHDSGFIYQREHHEAASIRLAEHILPEFGYAHETIAVIRGIIQATCIPQSPTNLLEMIMADADLDYLGAENFWERSQDLRQELENHGTKFTNADWYLYQLQFIQGHRYFTKSAQSMRNNAKHRHILEIQKQLERALQNQ